jgi:hypothetical protein
MSPASRLLLGIHINLAGRNTSPTEETLTNQLPQSYTHPVKEKYTLGHRESYLQLRAARRIHWPHKVRGRYQGASGPSVSAVSMKMRLRCTRPEYLSSTCRNMLTISSQDERSFRKL